MPSHRFPRIARVVFAVVYLLGSAANLILFIVDRDAYRGFADASYIPFVQNTWRTLVDANLAVFIPLLIVFEALVGSFLLIPGRGFIRAGLAGAVGFHLGLMTLGWGFWLWAVPALSVLAVVVRDELRGSPGVEMLRRSLDERAARVA